MHAVAPLQLSPCSTAACRCRARRCLPPAMRALSASGSTGLVCSASVSAPSRRVRRARSDADAASKATVVAVFDPVGEARLDLVERDRRRQHDAARRRRAGQFGDREERLARQRRGRIDIAAAAVGEQKCAAAAAVLGDAVGIGEREQRPHPPLRRSRASSSSPPASAVHGSGEASAHRFAMARASSARRERSRRNWSSRWPRSTIVAAEPALGQHGGDLGGQRAGAFGRGIDHHAREPRRQRQRAQLAAFVGDAALGIERAELAEQRARLGKRGRAAADRGRRACPDRARPSAPDRARTPTDRRREFPAAHRARASRSAARPTAGSRRPARCGRRGRGAGRRRRATRARFPAASGRRRARSAARARARCR